MPDVCMYVYINIEFQDAEKTMHLIIFLYLKKFKI